jgi:uncharacterized membrane protein
MRTWITTVSTLLGTFLCIGITQIIIQLTNGGENDRHTHQIE